MFEFLLLEETQKKLRKVGNKEGAMYVFPLSCNGNFFWIYVREINKQLYCYFNSNKDGNNEIKFCGEWKVIHFKEISVPSTHQFINEQKNLGGKMLCIKNIKCIPFMVTSYNISIDELLSRSINEGIYFDIPDTDLLQLTLRNKPTPRAANPFIFKRAEEESVLNLIDSLSLYTNIWDLDAMFSIGNDLKKSGEISKTQYVSLVPTLNGQAGVALCTVQRSQHRVEIGLYSPEYFGQIAQDKNHPVYGEILAFSN